MNPIVEDITTFFDTLDADTVQSSPDGECTFSDGEALFICTHSARRVAAYFGGRVVGFRTEANANAEIAWGNGGHDFAIVGDRFVVDYWAVRITGLHRRGVFDLNSADDRLEIARLYGPAEDWQNVPNLKAKIPNS